MELCGYTSAEAVGRTCRILQGPETSLPVLSDLHAAITKRRSTVVRGQPCTPVTATWPPRALESCAAAAGPAPRSPLLPRISRHARHSPPPPFKTNLPPLPDLPPPLSSQVRLINYKKSGARFVNELSIEPLLDAARDRHALPWSPPRKSTIPIYSAPASPKTNNNDDDGRSGGRGARLGSVSSRALAHTLGQRGVSTPSAAAPGRAQPGREGRDRRGDRRCCCCGRGAVLPLRAYTPRQ